MKKLNALKIAIQEEQALVKRARNRIALLRRFAPQIKALGIVPSGYRNCIDFDNLKHDQIVTALKLWPGKWNKEYTDTARITYTLKGDDFMVRCWNGEPPPNCKLVKEIITIPSRYVPEHTEERLKLVCNDNGDNHEQNQAAQVAA